MENNAYKCTAAQLYAVARTGWSSYLVYLSQFATCRGFYDEAYANAALAGIDATEAIPEFQSRQAATEVLRTELQDAGNHCLVNWQQLKRYIDTAFPPAMHKPRLHEAGSLRYRKASSQNWKELKTLNVQALNFLHEHEAALLANRNMPAGFIQHYISAADLFAARMEHYFLREEQGIAETRAKLDANNQVYNQLINMFKDGQTLFRKEDAIRRLFTFDKVLAMITGSHKSRKPKEDKEGIIFSETA